MRARGPVTLRDAATELKRELRLRERVYPDWIARGRLKQSLADLQIARLKLALATVEQAADAAESSERLL